MECRPSSCQCSCSEGTYSTKKPVCWVEASGEKVSFVLKEKKKRIMFDYAAERKRNLQSTYEDLPSGVFEFSINAGWGFGHTSSWKDGKILRIESKLDQIVATIPLAGEFLKQERMRREKEEQRRKQLEELRYRMDAIKRKEEAALEILLNHSTNHRRACDLKEFIETTRALYLQDHGKAPSENSPEGLWLRWAEQRAETLDPLGGGLRPWNGQAFRQIPGLFPKS